jgi:RNA polymerase sigma factor (sigma-70 family)
VARHLPTLDGPSDAELISAVRSGQVDAYGELYARHVEAARRLARQLVSGPDVDDLVSEAFAKVLAVLQGGGGPDLAFRAYLLTAVRRLHVDRIRATARLHTTGDLTPYDPGVPFRDSAVEEFESGAAARAFASLPERWQLVLWHTEVEGQKPAEVAVLLGMSANSVSALAYRAREGLRQAYLSMHARDVDDDECARTRASLGAYLRGGLSRRDSARVEKHLEECRSCAAIYLELSEVNSHLGVVLAPLLLGAAATAYVGSAAGGAPVAIGGIAMLLGRARDLVLAHAPTAAVTGAAASAVVAGALVVAHHGTDLPTAERPPIARIAPSTTETPIARHTRPAQRTERPAVRTASTPASGAPAPSPPPQTGPTEPAAPQSSTPPSFAPPPSAPPPSSTPSTPSSPAPSSPASSRPPLVRLDASASVGPDGVGLGLSAGVAGLPPLPPVTLHVP